MQDRDRRGKDRDRSRDKASMSKILDAYPRSATRDMLETQKFTPLVDPQDQRTILDKLARSRIEIESERRTKTRRTLFLLLQRRMLQKRFN